MHIKMAEMIAPTSYPDWNWDRMAYKFCCKISALKRCQKLLHIFSSTKRCHRRCCCCCYKKGFNYVLFIMLCCCYLIDCKLIAADNNLKLSAENVGKEINVVDSENAPLLVDEEEYEHDEVDEYQLLITNKSAKGMYIGAPCDQTCNSNLLHVQCDELTNLCGCERNYPVKLGLTKGCAKPKKLGEQCWWHQTCTFNDANSLCVQVKHNALCQCSPGYHSVTYTKPSKRVFCTQDMAVLTSDLPTLLGVSTGIAVLAGLICMVLHLFSKTKYPRHRHYGDANIAPQNIMYSTDTVHSARPSSRGSLRSSNSIGSYTNRRPSSAPQSGSKGILVSTSRSGSRRPSLASVHSTSSSVKSYSLVRIEKELQQKELRQEMKLRLARLQQHQQQTKQHIAISDPLLHGVISKSALPSPSPLTPKSTDELLPSLDELQELSPPESIIASNDASYIGPCSSNEALLN